MVWLLFMGLLSLVDLPLLNCDYIQQSQEMPNDHDVLEDFKHELHHLKDDLVPENDLLLERRRKEGW